MGAISKYDQSKDEMTFKCDCGITTTFNTSSFSSSFNDEIGGFENYHLACQCGVVHSISMDIPLGENDEYELETTIMPYEEINTRKYLRDFIWAKRTDLKNISRENYKKDGT